jgi:16S rRNA (adenine1518-N6/adenine1519-N6)-dimethyltransferase
VVRCERLTVVELDRDLAARLRKNPALDVVESDVLRVDFGALADRLGGEAAAGRPVLKVAGNLPYNISTPILFHLLPWAHRVIDQHFMLQKEVVDRMASGPGSKAYGRLSVMLQWRYDIESLIDVPPESFVPPPKVESAVVRMTPLPHFAPIDLARFEAMVAAAFSQRRKLLRHSLGRWLDEQGFTGEFDLQRRAEEVPVAEFVALAQALG